jgi:deoxyribodipyrimidine photolyase-like uncharacterized protein
LVNLSFRLSSRWIVNCFPARLWKKVEKWRNQEQISISQIEGFVRQQLVGENGYGEFTGWRFESSVRWIFLKTNETPRGLDGKTKMNCLNTAFRSRWIMRTLTTFSDYDYGEFRPHRRNFTRRSRCLYLGIYIDAIEWADYKYSRSQFADGESGERNSRGFRKLHQQNGLLFRLFLR